MPQLFSAKPNAAYLYDHALPQSGACYATIGPRSEVDVVRIGGKLLSVGNVVSIVDGETLKAARMYKSVLPRLELQLWMPGEVPIPAPRAPQQQRATWAYAAGVDATWTLQMVIPASGRRSVRLSFDMDTASGVANYDFAVEAWMFGDPDNYVAGGKSNTSVLDGSTRLVPGASVTGNTNDAYTITLGGWNAEQWVDEYLVYTRKPLAGTVTGAQLEAVAYGELVGR